MQNSRVISSNIKPYLDKNGKYNPELSEKRRKEIKASGKKKVNVEKILFGRSDSSQDKIR